MTKPSYFVGDWQHVENVDDAKFITGEDRHFSACLDCKVLVANPNDAQNQAAAAEGIRYSASNVVITIFGDTLVRGVDDERVRPDIGDKIRVAPLTWIIQSVKQVMYADQYVCYCIVMPGTDEIVAGR